ncbi:Lar family restriction alleviation protein [Phyllobacterium sp. K27]
MSETQDKLKPCPMCGSDARIRYSPSIGGDNKADTSMASIACSNPVCITIPYETTENAINRWNSRALSALTQGGVKVKELEWKRHGSGYLDADSVVGPYEIQLGGASYMFSLGGRYSRETYPTLAAAKAAAQADYDARIRSALSTTLQEPEKALELAARLSEYRSNPHHVNPISSRFIKLFDETIAHLRRPTLAHQPVTAGLEAERDGIEIAARYHDDLENQHAASHEDDGSDFHKLMEKTHRKSASDIRALAALKTEGGK